MILLGATVNWKIQVITDTNAGSVKVHVSPVLNASGVISFSPDNIPAITSNTTTDVLVGSAYGTTNLKFMSVRNDSASVSNGVTIQLTDGTDAIPLWKGTLLPGESVNFNEGVGWQYLDANGAPKAATGKADIWLCVTNDVTNATTSFADVTGLTTPVLNGKKYAFEAHLFYQTNINTTGAQFGVNGPATTTLIVGGIRTVTNSVTGAAVSAGVVTAVDTADQAQTTGPGAVNSYGIMVGFIQPSASGTFAIRSKSEVAVAGGLVIKAGSWLHLREVDN